MRLPTAVADFDDFLPPQRTKESPRSIPTLLKPQARKPAPKGHRRVHSMEIERINGEIPQFKIIDSRSLKNEQIINNLIIPEVVITTSEHNNLTKTSSDESIAQKLKDSQTAKSIL